MRIYMYACVCVYVHSETLYCAVRKMSKPDRDTCVSAFLAAAAVHARPGTYILRCTSGSDF